MPAVLNRLNERGLLVKLVIDPSACTGCMNCQTVCSLVHAGKHLPGASAIRVKLEVIAGVHSHIYCRHCAKPLCSEACTENAISRNEATGAVELDTSMCTNCGACIAACPFGAIFHSRHIEHPVKCHLCGGDPMCAEACVFNAITLKDTL